MQKLGYGPDKRLAVTVTTRNVAAYRDPAVILIDQLKEIYIDGTLNAIDTTQWYPTVMRKDYTLAFTVTETGLDDPDQMFYENYFCGSERNYTGYCNPEVDKLIDQQSVETDVRQAPRDRLANRAVAWRRMAVGRSSFTRAGDLRLSAGQGHHGRRQQPVQRVADGRRLARPVGSARLPADLRGEIAEILFQHGCNVRCGKPRERLRNCATTTPLGFHRCENHRCRLPQKKVERPAWVMRRTPSAQVQSGHGSPSLP